MRARLIVPAVAAAGFALTLGLALWQNRAAHPGDTASVPAPLAPLPAYSPPHRPADSPPPPALPPRAPEPAATAAPFPPPRIEAPSPPEPAADTGEDAAARAARQTRIAHQRDDK